MEKSHVANVETCMTLQLIRKPPTNKSFNERLKITLLGNHTLK